MDKKILEKHIKNDLTIREISDATSKSFTTIRYWLKKYDLKTRGHKNDINNKNKHCLKCGVIKPVNEFYRRRNDKSLQPYCKECTNKQVVNRQRNFKLECVKYKGGKCSKCGYDKCISALEFHHLDPKEKDFNVSRVKGTTFNDKVRKELDKCILVCSNCHREIHYNKID